MKKNKGKNTSKQDREMKALLRKMQRKTNKQANRAVTEYDDVPKRAASRDVDGERDWDIRSVDADRLFREMKKRDR